MSDSEQLIGMIQKQMARIDELVDRHESHYQDMRQLAISYAELTREIMGITSITMETNPVTPDPALKGGELE